MPQRSGGFFHLHLVSDATGETLITVARAAAAQYASVAPIEHIYPLVRTEKQLDRVISEIEAAPGIVLYTMLDSALAERLQTKCREFSIPCLSILDPVLGLNAHRDDDLYVDRQAVAEEIAFSRKLCARHNWPIIDVTRRSIEETAAAVMALLSERRRQVAS